MLIFSPQIGCSKEGVVNAIKITIYCNEGWKKSLVVDALLMTHIDNGE